MLKWAARWLVERLSPRPAKPPAMARITVYSTPKRGRRKRAA